MHWITCSALAVLVLAITETTALSLRDPDTSSSQLKKSIEHLVESIVEPDHQPKVEIEPLSSRGNVRDADRKRFLVDSKLPKDKAPLPSPVQISTNPITINGANGTGGKRTRSLEAPTNPHRKRQVYVQDATQFLAAQGMISPQTTLIDGSTLQAVNNQGGQQQQQTFYYTPQPYLQQQDGSIYATAAPMTFQTVTAVPISNQGQQGQMYVLQQDGQSYAAYTPAPYQGQQHQSQNTRFVSRAGEVNQGDQAQQASVAVPVQVSQPQVSIISKASPLHHQINQQQQQSRSETKAEQKQEKQAPAQLTQQQLQHQQAQEVLQQIHRQVEVQQQLQRQVEVQQQLQAQQLAEQRFQEIQAAQAQQQQAQAAQAQENQAAQIQQQAQAAQAQQQQQQQVQSSSTILIPQGASTLIQTQNVQQGDSLQQQQPISQLVQVQQQPNIQTMFQAGNGQTYILHQNPSTDTFEERQSVVPQQGQNQFIIKPQTYVTGPGGQMFTVPVPVPAEQEENNNSGEEQQPPPEHRPRRPQHRNRDRERDRERHDRERHDRDRDREHEEGHRRPSQTFMNRIMEAFSVKGSAIDRVETNIALPVLATTGVFFGLGALAAGWFLSSANREVGILRRTGKPVPGPPGSPNVQRIRRHAPTGGEVDQATFFQSIIQTAIEKQQQEFEETVEPQSAPSQVQIRPAPVRHSSSSSKPSKRVKPHAFSRNDYQEDEYESPIEKVSSKPVRKSGWSRQALNFAKVAIPAIVLGGAVLAIGALIFGWYISGSNREIAFLEPSAYSRRKRDLTTTALSDGWLQRLLSSIHESPYDKGGVAGTNAVGGSVFDPDTSKHSSLEYHANLSDAVVAVSLVVVAFFSLMGIVLAWFFAENEKSNLGVSGPYGFGGWPGNYRNSRSRRSLSSNDLSSGPHLAHNPTFLESILTNLEVSQNSILNKLQETGYAKWQETPCAKRIFCDVMSAQGDDTVRAMEKRMSTFISMLPDTLSSTLSRSLGEVVMSIQRRDCSAYTCGGHWVDPSIIDQPSPPTNQPR